MVLHATTRWVEAYYELKSLLPYKEAVEFLNARKQEEAGFNITLPTDFWSVANEMFNCLEPVVEAITESVDNFFSFKFFPSFFKNIFPDIIS